MATQVGEAVIKLSFDGKDVQASLQKVESSVNKSATSSGKSWGDAWTTAAGMIISQGIMKVTGAIASNLDNAIARVDTLANSQKVFQAMGYSAEATSKSMSTLNSYLDGLPTSMTAAVKSVQSLSASFGGIERGTQAFIDMNNAGLAFGATSAMIDNAIMQLGQLSMDGPLDGATWRSLQNSGFAPVFTAMAKMSGTTIGQLKSQFGKGEKTVADFLDQLHKLGTEGGGGMESLNELARKNTSGIGTAFENVGNRISKAIAKVIDYIGQQNISGFINSVSASFSGLADVIINAMNFIVANWAWIQPILTSVLAFFAGLMAMGIGAKIIGFLTTTASLIAAHPVLAILSAIVLAIQLVANNFEALSEVVTGVFDWIGQQLEAVGELFSSTWENTVKGAQAAWNGITGIFKNLANFFGSIFSNAWNAVKKVFSTGGRIFDGIKDGIVNAFKTVVNAIIGGINRVVAIPFNAINGVLDGLRGIDILGIRPFGWLGRIDVPRIPTLAQGGYASGATGAIIGEAGKEVVLPLERNTDNWAGLLASTLAKQMEQDGVSGRPIVVNMTNQINNEMDAEDIGRVLMQSIRRAS